ncbi:hypothetical protein CSV60_14095 [Sporosarcina sp. P7]|nr:hypothetical protein CSV60_14095 [Sporosarcina sp. P7]
MPTLPAHYITASALSNRISALYGDANALSNGTSALYEEANALSPAKKQKKLPSQKTWPESFPQTTHTLTL